jgi:hypothetical protein
MLVVLKAQINKTDRNDARGIAHMINGFRCFRGELINATRHSPEAKSYLCQRKWAKI